MKVSNSQIGCFKACRRMYELKYIHGLEPVKTAETLQRGLSYHQGVEAILRGEKPETDDPKIRAMLAMFAANTSFSVEDIEKWFEYQTASGHTVIGRMDAVSASGTPIEHKTTSGLIDGEYMNRLELDEQIPTYMLATNKTMLTYTVISTPTIRQKKDEDEEAFFNRCVEWFYDSNRAQKFVVSQIALSQNRLTEFAEEQNAVINEMATCKLFYRNPSHCMKWGRLCEYAPICMHYDPNMEYIEFKRREIRENGNTDA
ncbi:MAG: PD-(D/E)XK nuclease family protein [Clostridia bacterium]|nr:PD-(D/E)XK nuclease family protein [Clostridia bacterium]